MYKFYSENAIVSGALKVPKIDYSSITPGQTENNRISSYRDSISYNGVVFTAERIVGSIFYQGNYTVGLPQRNSYPQNTQNYLTTNYSPTYRFRLSNDYSIALAFAVSNDVNSRYDTFFVTNNNKTPFGKTYAKTSKTLDKCSYSGNYNGNREIGLAIIVSNGIEYMCLCELYASDNQSRLDFKGYRLTDFNNFGTLKYDEISEEYGEYSSGGGYGKPSFDDSSDVIGIPNKPSLSVSSMGFVNVYRPSTGGLSGMVNELFPVVDIPDIPTGDSLADVVNSLNGLIDTVANGIIQFGNKNMLDYVLDAHIIPVTPEASASTNIKVGYKTLSITAPKVINDYVDFDCGTLNLKEYYNNYIDYTACSISLYLPFVGFVPLLPEHCLNGSLKVVYRFNILDGSFCAWVLSTSSKSKLSNSIIGSFSGNCCVHIPISASNYSNVISGLVGGVSGMLNAIPSKDNANISGAVDSASEVVQSLKPDIALSNGYNATSSYSGIRYPYVIIRRQVASFSKNYTKENGLPLNVSDKISNFSGLTFASEIILDGISATDYEKQQIKNLFKEGVIL